MRGCTLFQCFSHYTDLKCAENGLKFVKKRSYLKYYDLKWNFELGGLLNDQGLKAYFNKIS